MFKEKEDDIEVVPDTGEPVVTEAPQWGIQEKAFQPLVTDEEKNKINEQKNDEEMNQIMYVSGKKNTVESLYTFIKYFQEDCQDQGL